MCHPHAMWFHWMTLSIVEVPDLRIIEVGHLSICVPAAAFSMAAIHSTVAFVPPCCVCMRQRSTLHASMLLFSRVYSPFPFPSPCPTGPRESTSFDRSFVSRFVRFVSRSDALCTPFLASTSCWSEGVPPGVFRRVEQDVVREGLRVSNPSTMLFVLSFVRPSTTFRTSLFHVCRHTCFASPKLVFSHPPTVPPRPWPSRRTTSRLPMRSFARSPTSKQSNVAQCSLTLRCVVLSSMPS